MVRRLCWIVVAATLIAAGNWSFAQPADEQAKPAEEPAKAAAEPVKPTEEPAKPAEATPESQTHKWEFGISVRAIAGSCSEVHGTFPVPADWPEQQAKVINEQITPGIPPYKYRQIDGLKQVVFNASQVSAGSSVECYITFEVTKHAQLPPADTSKLVIPKNPSLDIKKFLNPSPLIEATNPKVRSLAKELTEGKETAWEQVQAIQAGVREAVAYEQNPKDKNKGVLAVLRDKKADREDLNATFVAVCRAAKIPARMVWCPDFCYAEFYLEEIPAADDSDASEVKSAKDKKAKGAKGNWYPCVMHRQNSQLGACDDFMPILGKGDNFKVPEEKLVQRWVKLFWIAKGAAKPAAEFRVRPAD